MNYPLPKEFIERIKSQFGDDSDQFINSLDHSVSNSVRLNPSKEKPLLELGNPVPWCENGYYINARPIYTLDPLFHAGSYYPQESSSMFLCHILKEILSVDNENIVLDLCGAPGGKSTLIASHMNNKGVLVANEVIKSRASILKENIIKWGFSNVVVSQNDPADFTKMTSLFDLVLVDAPCSGEGIFRKDQASRNEWSIPNTELCTLRQRRIISDIWPSIKEGGYLIYSTCTYNPNENEENINWLLEREDGKVINIPVNSDWPVSRVKLKEGMGYGFYPHLIAGEGLFIVVVQKQGASKNKFRFNTKLQINKAVIPDYVIINQSEFEFIENKGSITAVKKSLKTIIHYFISNLKIVYSGLEMGSQVRNDFNPSHALAMSSILNSYFPKVDLPLEIALKYLKGESNLGLKLEKGWHIVTYKSQPLGFVKSIGDRLNNYYPKEYRIRMSIENI